MTTLITYWLVMYFVMLQLLYLQDFFITIGMIETNICQWAIERLAEHRDFHIALASERKEGYDEGDDCADEHTHEEGDNIFMHQ